MIYLSLLVYRAFKWLRIKYVASRVKRQQARVDSRNKPYVT